VRSSNLSSLLRALAAMVASACLFTACDKGADKAPRRSAAPPVTTGAGATADPAPALHGATYGAGVTIDDKVSIDDLLADPAAYDGKTVRVEGMVTDVCPKRGCWMDLAGDGPGKKVRFKVDDGVMTFPLEAKGSQAVAQGKVAVQRLSLEESREYAQHQAEEYGATYDPASITEPMMIVRIDGTGAVLREPK